VIDIRHDENPPENEVLGAWMEIQIAVRAKA
jgi:hypothetical protein